MTGDNQRCGFPSYSFPKLLCNFPGYKRSHTVTEKNKRTIEDRQDVSQRVLHDLFHADHPRLAETVFSAGKLHSQEFDVSRQAQRELPVHRCASAAPRKR